MRVLLVGGGSPGAFSNWAGGSGGYVACGTFNVSNSTSVPVNVGSGAMALSNLNGIDFIKLL